MTTKMKMKGEFFPSKDTQMDNLQYLFFVKHRANDIKMHNTNTSSFNCNCHKDNIDLDKGERG